MLVFRLSFKEMGPLLMFHTVFEIYPQKSQLNFQKLAKIVSADLAKKLEVFILETNVARFARNVVK